MDSIQENWPPNEQPEKSTEDLRALTDLAFELEQDSHFDDPRGAVMFAGEFPHTLISTFQEIEKNPEERPKTVPKMRMYACSRELQYGLSRIFGYEKGIKLPNEPVGRVRPGSTMIWEVWKIKGEFFVDTLLFQPGMKGVIELQPRANVTEYHEEYKNAIAETGSWQKICPTSQASVDPEAHGSMFWFVFFVLLLTALVVTYRRAYARGAYQPL
jgi:hypothetical protein